MILSALLAVLALAGAPSTTKVDCNPALPQSVELGLTASDQATVIDGRIVQGALDHIFLGPLSCGGLLYASESASERLATRRMNPGVDFDRLLAVGLQVALHEAEHVALNSTNECQVEKVTRQSINRIIDQYSDPGRQTQAEQAATASDASLPVIYHGC